MRDLSRRCSLYALIKYQLHGLLTLTGALTGVVDDKFIHEALTSAFNENQHERDEVLLAYLAVEGTRS